MHCLSSSDGGDVKDLFLPLLLLLLLDEEDDDEDGPLSPFALSARATAVEGEGEEDCLFLPFTLLFLPALPPLSSGGTSVFKSLSPEFSFEPVLEALPCPPLPLLEEGLG
jgi:hypothetical protein